MATKVVMAEETRVGIIGTGDYARALAKNLYNSKYEVICGSRYPEKRSLTRNDPKLKDIQITSIRNCVNNADIVFLCVRAKNHESVVKNLVDDLNGKILVDISNREEKKKKADISHAEKLQKLLPHTSVVKAFNTLSAYEVESDIPTNDRPVLICGDDPTAKHRVEALVQDMGFSTVVRGGLRQARELEELPLQLFKGWGGPSLCSLIVFLAWTIGAIIKVHVKDKWRWDDLPVLTLNKAFACTGVTLFSFCFLPGCIAALMQLSNGTKYRPFPSWMDKWLKARKALGLYALLFVGLHVIYSLIILDVNYRPRLYSVNSTLTARSGGGILAGLFSFAVMIILGITSIPAVGKLLNWSEWRFIQSHLGWFGLILAGTHPSVICTWNDILSTSFFCLVIPYITLGLKVIITTPCVYIRIEKIRQGYESGTASVEDGSGNYKAKCSPRVSTSGSHSALNNSNASLDRNSTELREK